MVSYTPQVREEQMVRLNLQYKGTYMIMGVVNGGSGLFPCP